MIWKTGFAAIQGQLQCNLNVDFGDSLYRMPFTHVEALIFGCLLGRGSLKIVARYQIPILFLTVAAGLINFCFARGEMRWSTLGFPMFLTFNYQYLWGYPLLALAAASLLAPGGFVARAIQQF